MASFLMDSRLGSGSLDEKCTFQDKDWGNKRRGFKGLRIVLGWVGVNQNPDISRRVTFGSPSESLLEPPGSVLNRKQGLR